MPPASSTATLFCAALVLALPGCSSSPKAARAAADRETYQILLERRAALFGEEGPFSIDPPVQSLRQDLLRGEAPSPITLDLLGALKVAAENSRDYQSRKERLYQTALDLTLERWRFSNQWTGTGSASVDGSGEHAQGANASGELGMTRLLGSGARIVSNIGASLFRVLTTGDGWDAIGDLGLGVTVPLLRGSAREIVLEPLTQAERDVVYEVRNFERFRRTFAFDVATRYFRLLQTRDSVENEQANFDSLALLRKRNEALSEAGQLSDIQVDQARQDELASENRLLVLRQNYESQLDSFKLFLGLPPETRIEIDPAALGTITVPDADPPETRLDEDAAYQIAVRNRLDYLNAADAVADAERKVRVAADALRTGLDLGIDASSSSLEGRPASFRGSRSPWSASLSFDLPLDRLPERNSYRSSQINFQAAVREQERMADTIRSNLRDDLRQIRTTLQSYRIQQNAVRLANERVDSAKMKLSAGRSSTRDVLESQRSLLAASDAATRARIDYWLARLSLYNELELLRIEDRGIVTEDDALPTSAPSTATEPSPPGTR